MNKIYILLLFSVLVSGFTAQVTYTGKPMYKIDVKRQGVFLGSITIELFPNIAYHHVRNFDSLVSVQFFDTIKFHRVVPGFVIQGGDPNSRHGNVGTWGQGQPGQPMVNAEFSVAKHLRGTVSAARQANNINSATSQFFICVANTPQLNNNYSIYGRTIAGMNWVDTIVLAPTATGTDRPLLDHEMYVTAIGSNDTIPKAPVLNTPPDTDTLINTGSAHMLKWNNVKDGIIYTLEVSDDPGFTNIVQTTKTANLSYYVTGLSDSTQYYWRVRTNNGGHFSTWSTEWKFMIVQPKPLNQASIPSISSGSEKVTVFPNPGPGKFTFFNLQKGSEVVIYDIGGKEILRTAAKEASPTIDLEGLDKGIYTYKISFEGKETEGKLILQ